MSDSVMVNIPKLTPVTNPQEIKAMVVKEYTRKAHLPGMPSSREEIEKYAQEELELVDAFNRNKSKPATKKKVVSTRGKTVSGHAKSLGHSMARPKEERKSAPNLGGIMPMHINEKWMHATARIFRIIENDGGTKVACIDKALKATAVPKLAREFIEVWFHYQTRDRISRFNPFLGLSDKDSSRKFMNCVYNICDKSTGILGFWHIK